MICFQKLFFISLPTTCWKHSCYEWWLWFAFKNCSLYLYQQHQNKMKATIKGCDLLSKIVLYIFTNNFMELDKIKFKVVICFQKLFFISLPTTLKVLFNNSLLLWFAFKNCSLYLYQQRMAFQASIHNSCDLLSKIVLYIFTNNAKDSNCKCGSVVICFQKLFFISLPTTSYSRG